MPAEIEQLPADGSSFQCTRTSWWKCVKYADTKVNPAKPVCSILSCSESQWMERNTSIFTHPCQLIVSRIKNIYLTYAPNSGQVAFLSTLCATAQCHLSYFTWQGLQLILWSCNRVKFPPPTNAGPCAAFEKIQKSLVLTDIQMKTSLLANLFIRNWWVNEWFLDYLND